MFTVEVKRGKYAGTYPVFSSVGEYKNWCKEHNMEPEELVYWKDITTEHIGKYAVFENGYVLRVLNVYVENRTGYIGFIVTPVGSFSKRSDGNIDPNIIKAPYQYYYEKRKDRHAHKKYRILAQLVVNGVPLETAVMSAFGIKKDSDYINVKIKNLQYDKRFINMVKEEVKKQADKLGYTHEYVLKALDNLYKNAEDEKIKLQAIEKLGDAIGTFEKEETPAGELPGFGRILQMIRESKVKQLGEPNGEEK